MVGPTITSAPSYANAAEMREANRHWRQARRTARQTGDQELLEAIESIRRHFQRMVDMIEAWREPRRNVGDVR